MNSSTADVRCSICYRLFCCKNCRRHHELKQHGLIFECIWCRGDDEMALKHEDVNNRSFAKHVTEAHLPVRCRKCYTQFNTLDDLIKMTEKCLSLSQLLDSDFEKKYSETETKFQLLFDTLANEWEQEVEPSSKELKTAIVTPIMSNTEISKEAIFTPNLKNKYLKRPADFFGGAGGRISDNRKLTPIVPAVGAVHDITTPTNLFPRHNLGTIGSTSTPTHPIFGGCVLFPESGGDSPVSNINETTGQNLPQTPVQETPKMDEYLQAPQLKGILSNTKIRTSQDSGEKQVTFHDSDEIIDISGQKTKRVSVAQNTVKEQEENLRQREYRKPVRMLTPRPQRSLLNPNNVRFRELIQRFEHQGLTPNPTPVTRIRDRGNDQTHTVADYSSRPARAINFKEDSQIVEKERSAQNKRLEIIKRRVESSEVRTAISRITKRIAGPLQDCLRGVLKEEDGATQIKFKFVFSKSRCKLDSSDFYEADDEDVSVDNLSLCNISWDDPKINTDTLTPNVTDENSVSSRSKRKSDQLSEDETSPFNHKRHKYKGRIQGRPPLRRRRH